MRFLCGSIKSGNHSIIPRNLMFFAESFWTVIPGMGKMHSLVWWWHCTSMHSSLLCFFFHSTSLAPCKVCGVPNGDRTLFLCYFWFHTRKFCLARAAVLLSWPPAVGLVTFIEVGSCEISYLLSNYRNFFRNNFWEHSKWKVAYVASAGLCKCFFGNWSGFLFKCIT